MEGYSVCVCMLLGRILLVSKAGETPPGGFKVTRRFMSRVFCLLAVGKVHRSRQKTLIFNKEIRLLQVRNPLRNIPFQTAFLLGTDLLPSEMQPGRQVDEEVVVERWGER